MPCRKISMIAGFLGGLILYDLTSPAVVRDLLRRHNLRPRKGLGQNFLVDANIANKIVMAAELANTDAVIEIGPGLGVLTSRLAQSAGLVAAVEIDRHLVPVLGDVLKGYADRAHIICADALKVDLDDVIHAASGGRFGKDALPYKLVANLPYYITTPLVMRFLEAGYNINGAVIMVQEEVARRMVAVSGSSDFGALSVGVQFYARAEVAFRVPRTVFYPCPEVGSAVVRLLIRDTPAVEVPDRAKFFDIVRAAFGQRRKTLANALAGAGARLGPSKEEWAALANNAGINHGARGETLGLAEFARLAAELDRWYNTKQ